MKNEAVDELKSVYLTVQVLVPLVVYIAAKKWGTSSCSEVKEYVETKWSTSSAVTKDSW